MRKIIIVLGALLSGSVFAHDYPSEIRKCFIADGANQVQKCTLDSGGGAGGTYVHLTMGKRTFLMEESNMCEELGECWKVMGKDADSLEDSVGYFRDKNTKKVISKYKDGAWVCEKQVKGKMNVCYSLK